MAFFEGSKMTAGYGSGPDIISSCSINVDRGEIVAILGPNGAGKSTAMKAMLGLLKLKSGSVIIDGKDISILSPQDIENEFGLKEGNLNHGEMTLDQFMFMRPTISSSQYSTPIKNLYICGGGTHTGGGLHGANGYNAAKTILKIW